MMSPKEYLIKLKKIILTQSINKNNIEELTDSNLEEQDKETINKILEEATKNIFPKTGGWSSCCYDKLDDLSKTFLPCHLRDDEWLAKMLKKDQKLYNLNHEQIINFIKTSNYFTKKGIATSKK